MTKTMPDDARGRDTQPEAERVYREHWSIGRNHARKRAGIDVTALQDNLDRTVSERIRRHRMALNTVQQLQRAKRCE